MSVKPRVEIEYCTQCRWLLRAGWTPFVAVGQGNATWAKNQD